MIPYLEIVRETADGYLKTFSIIEPSECWFELSYQDIGEFEIYCPATPKNLKALQKGYYVKIPNRRFGWVITSIQYEFIKESGIRMISAKGYELKWLLKKRIIQKPTALQTRLFQAVHSLVHANLGGGASEERRIPQFKSMWNTEVISIPKIQATRENLGDFVNTLLKTYSCGSTAFMEEGDGNTYEIVFRAYKGQNRANTVLFTQSVDNLLSSTYYSSDAEVATFALVVSEVEDVEYMKTYDNGAVGSKRSEILVESNTSTSFEDENGVDQEVDPTSEEYQGYQEAEGKNELAKHTTIEEVASEIDLQNSLFEFETDFFIGDIVRTQDEYFGYSKNVRIGKITIKQDASGYGEELEFNE